jgi:DNA-binding MarR family transcriptional regulator
MPEDSQQRAGRQGRARRSNAPRGRTRQELRPPRHNTADMLGVAWARLGHQIVAGVVAAGYALRPAHSGVFAHIELDGTRLTELANRANMTPQAMGELVDDLERRGYVRRVPDPGDRRAKLIVPTEIGYGCLQAAFDTIGGIEQRLEELIGPRRLSQLRSTLARIIAAETAPHSPA